MTLALLAGGLGRNRTTPISDVPFANVVLLLHGNGTDGSTTFTDSSNSPMTFSAIGNAQIDTADAKFGGASILFDGSGDYLQASSTPAKLQLGTADWTIEGWVKLAATGSIRELVVLGESSLNKGLRVAINASNELSFAIIGGSLGSLGTNVTFSTSWAHFRVVRVGTTIYGFINGTLLNGAQTIAATNFVQSTAEKSFVGGSSFVMNGWLDDIRICNVALSTVGFTPPTSQFADS